MPHSPTTKCTIRKYNGNAPTPAEDILAVEEPLEIRVVYGPQAARIAKTLSITMRTPGDDVELVTGFLFTEGIVRDRSSIVAVETAAANIAIAQLHPELQFDLSHLERHFYTTSSCGVCGKTSIDALKTAIVCPVPAEKAVINPKVIYSLPEQLRQAQSTFDATGGIHAAALFDQEGRLLSLREDVGRHNALDKLIGYCLGQFERPLQNYILLLSGRASFELIQKAAMAGIGTVCAVGAPSSLAVSAAQEFGIVLIGFLRDQRFNQYLPDFFTDGGDPA